MRIGIVGAGVAGVAAAWRLDPRHEVTLIEAAPRLGGHTCTLTVPSGADEGTAVDAGFITFNPRAYPLFVRWLAALQVPSRLSDMSWGYTCERTGLTYGGHDLNTLFARRRHLLHPDFLRMVWDIARFNRRAQRDLNPPGSLRDYVRPYTRTFVRHYLLPLGAAIWSSPPEEILDFPARTYLRFFHNHGLLSTQDRPDWHTVVGGSQRYLDRFQAGFRGRVLLGRPAEQVRRGPERVEVRVGGDWLEFDHLVLAAHADQSLRLLADPTPAEQRLLGSWRYQANRAVVHTDVKVLSRGSRVQASWNYQRTTRDGPATLVYDMNRLQGLRTCQRYLVSLNPVREPAAERTLADLTFHHPVYTEAAVASQSETVTGRTSYCGSYRGYGFHEDALRSAVEATEPLGARAL